ncbi:MAG: endonuclease Q family protein, partial [Candidatus Anstonellaceae archaeon]
NQEFLKLDGVYFLPATEVNNIFEDNKKRRIHNLIIFSNLEECEQFNDAVEKKSYMGLDGRLCLKLNLMETLDYIFSIKKEALFIPAHIWTPWYGLLGSKSGYDNIKEAFGEKISKIYALETGLSSDPPMNRRCAFLDNFALVSFSDAHSLDNIGREATILQLEKLNYREFFNSIKNKKIKKTIEFFPQEGKYYASGCKNCNYFVESFQERCPKCNKKIAQGVSSRIEILCPKREDSPKIKAEFCYIIPLKKLLAEIYKKSEKSKFIEQKYFELTAKYPELKILLKLDTNKIAQLDKRLAEAIDKMRRGKIKIFPGYDGIFGRVEIN